LRRLHHELWHERFSWVDLVFIALTVWALGAMADLVTR
jgi:hypothetical protein